MADNGLQLNAENSAWLILVIWSVIDITTRIYAYEVPMLCLLKRMNSVANLVLQFLYFFSIITVFAQFISDISEKMSRFYVAVFGACDDEPSAPSAEKFSGGSRRDDDRCKGCDECQPFAEGQPSPPDVRLSLIPIVVVLDPLDELLISFGHGASRRLASPWFVH